MDMFGHDYIAEHHPVITLPHLFQHFDEQVAATRAGEQSLATVATEGEEVQVVPSMSAFQAPGIDTG